jgi:hypothetical protein
MLPVGKGRATQAFDGFHLESDLPEEFHGLVPHSPPHRKR